jgi:hypothetical protein
VAIALSSDNGGAPQGTGTPGSSVRFPRGNDVARATGGGPSDTTFTIGHITWTLARQFYNSFDAPQSSYDPLTTVRMTIGARGTGEMETATDTAMFGASGILDTHGLAAAQDTLFTDGAWSDTLQCAFSSPYRSGRIHTYSELEGTFDQVVGLKPLSTNPWPLSGTATWDLEVDRLRTSDRGSVERHFHVTVVVTYNGTRYADAEVTGGRRYKIDLKTGAIARA